jgi:hypothetical protein
MADIGDAIPLSSAKMPGKVLIGTAEEDGRIGLLIEVDGREQTFLFTRANAAKLGNMLRDEVEARPWLS